MGIETWLVPTDTTTIRRIPRKYFINISPVLQATKISRFVENKIWYTLQKNKILIC